MRVVAVAQLDPDPRDRGPRQEEESPRLLRVAGFVARLHGFDGHAGFLLTQGIVCLTPFGIIGGILLGLTLAAPTNRLLQRLGAVQPARAYSPRYPRYRRGWP